MQKTLKTCSQCGTPVRVERTIPAQDVVCGRCDPAVTVQLESQPETPPDDLRMTGLGLIAFAIGLVCVVASQLTQSGLPAENYGAGVGFVYGLTNIGLILGYGLITVAGLMCMFTPDGSRATRLLLSALLMFLAVVLLRVSLMTGTVGEHFVVVSVAATVLWAILWSLYVWRVSEVVNRGDLGRRIAMVLPLPGLCLSIAWAANWLSAWNESMAVIRPLALCMTIFVGWTAIRLGCVFVGRNEVRRSPARTTTDGEQLQLS